MKKITAIIREDVQDDLVEMLRSHGIPGLSIVQVKGYGEYINTYAQDTLEPCIKVEILLGDDVSEKVAKLIMGLVGTGMEGDGVIAISPVDVLYRIRDQQEFR